MIDFLAAYLFPHGEKVIDQWIATGISLGGESGRQAIRDISPHVAGRNGADLQAMSHGVLCVKVSTLSPYPVTPINSSFGNKLCG